jgi:predicted ArsR family transcriptional regulator
MNTAKVMQHLKKHGQLLDSEIAAATGISLAQVRDSLTELSTQGEISRCTVTSFVDGKAIEGFQCRVAGYFPPAAPGRKPAK